MEGRDLSLQPPWRWAPETVIVQHRECRSCCCVRVVGLHRRYRHRRVYSAPGWCQRSVRAATVSWPRQLGWRSRSHRLVQHGWHIRESCRSFCSCGIPYDSIYRAAAGPGPHPQVQLAVSHSSATEFGSRSTPRRPASVVSPSLCASFVLDRSREENRGSGDRHGTPAQLRENIIQYQRALEGHTTCWSASFTG